MIGMDDNEKSRYGYAPEIFKQFLESIFGKEDYYFIVDDGQANKNGIIFSGELEGGVSYTAELNEDRAGLRLVFSHMLSEDDDGDHREFDCEPFELGEEIGKWVDEYLEDFPGDSEQSVEDWDSNIDCTVTLNFEPFFENAPENLMVNVHEINDKIKEILEEHEK